MPTAPESHCRIIIGHTPNHVLGRIHPVCKCPQAEETPRHQELCLCVSIDVRPYGDGRAYLEPDNDQVPEPDHRELGRCIAMPCSRILDCNHIKIMQNNLHRQQTCNKAHGVVEECTSGGWSRMTDLPSKVVKGHDGSGDVQWWVDGVGKEVRERVC
jgi:hypothetical protein